MRYVPVLVLVLLVAGIFYFIADAENIMTNTPDCSPMTGRILTEKDPGYEQARLVSNYYASKYKRPSAIVYCQNTQDVQNAVKWARCNNMTVHIRSGGHNHEGFSTGDNVLLIDVSEMKQLHIDKTNHIITAQPGLTNGELYSKLYLNGLTHVGGTCEGVGISGFTLSGGIGPLYKKFGLGCDNLVYLELVDANGNLLKATKDNEYKDLFWACQGGGAGNFGVVTIMKIKVYPAEDVTWFNIGWDWSQPIEEVVAAWQDFFFKSNDRWFSHIDLWSKAFPTKEYKKQPVKILGVFWGSPDQARRELQPILSIGKPIQQIERVNWLEAIKQFEESTSVFVTDRPEYKSTGTYLNKELPPNAVKEITSALVKSQYPLLNVLMFSFANPSRTVPADATAYYHRNAKAFISYSTQWLNPEDDSPQLAEVDTLRAKLGAYTEGDYIGNPDLTFKDYMKEYYGANAARLEEIKSKYDPDNVFSYPQSIPPAKK